tara:strand:- start:328 stop:549 length:222 start_codon:yes stop_codon:yes gene_type:complete
MCLGGGGPDYEYKEPKKKVWESKYELTPDTFNNKLLSDVGDYSQEATKHLTPVKAKLKAKYRTPTKQSEKIVS